MNQLQHLWYQIITQLGLSEHNAQLIVIAFIAGAVLFSGRHHVRRHYNRFRSYYHRRYRRRDYDDY
jgi:hypothetical protein